MTCLSIKNPLSYLVAAGVKDVENRTWTTDYRGRLYIHSSGAKDFFCFDAGHYQSLANSDALDALTEDSPTMHAMDRFYQWECARYGLSDFNDRAANFAAADRSGLALMCRSIVGHVDLVDIVVDSDSVWALPNHYHWVLHNAVLFDTPITDVVGRLKLFTVII